MIEFLQITIYLVDIVKCLKIKSGKKKTQFQACKVKKSRQLGHRRLRWLSKLHQKAVQRNLGHAQHVASTPCGSIAQAVCATARAIPKPRACTKCEHQWCADDTPAHTWFTGLCVTSAKLLLMQLHTLLWTSIQLLLRVKIHYIWLQQRRRPHPGLQQSQHHFLSCVWQVYVADGLWTL